MLHAGDALSKDLPVRGVRIVIPDPVRRNPVSYPRAFRQTPGPRRLPSPCEGPPGRTSRRCSGSASGSGPWLQGSSQRGRTRNAVSHFREYGIQRVHRPKAVALHLLSCKVRRHLLHRACNPVFRGKDGDVNPGKAGGRPLQRGGVRHIAPKKGQAPAAWKGRLCVLRVAGNAIDRCPFLQRQGPRLFRCRRQHR